MRLRESWPLSTGVIVELTHEGRPDRDDLSVDAAQFVAAARERLPADADRFREGSLERAGQPVELVEVIR